MHARLNMHHISIATEITCGDDALTFHKQTLQPLTQTHHIWLDKNFRQPYKQDKLK